jgi:hypothetical protein
MFVIKGSVKRRNLVPVNVWKQLRRKRSVSSTSMPDLARPGFGREPFDEVFGAGVDVPDELLGAADI